MRVVFVLRHHLDGTVRAVTGTVATFHALRIDNAVFGNPYGMANLNGGFLRQIDGADSAGGANLRATVALGATVATFVAHLGLHKAVETCRWAQYAVRTCADA